MEINGFPGLYLTDDASSVGLEGLVNADNIDLSRAGKVTRRSGRTLAYSGTIIDAWGDGEDFLFLEGTSLKRLLLIDSTYVAETLRTGLTNPTYLTCARAYGRLYWNTDFDCGVVQEAVERAWGIPTADRPVVTGLSAGDLLSGRYLVAAAYRDSNGQEGPLSEFALYDGESGISIPVPALTATLTLHDVVGLNLYLSTRNGTELYLAKRTTLAAATGTMSYSGDGSEFGVRAEYEFRSQLPLGFKLVSFNGRLWVGQADALIYSDEYSEMTDLRANFIPLPGRLQDFGAVEDGLFVATNNKIYWLGGRDLATMETFERASYGAIPGTFTQVDGRLIGEGYPQEALMWVSPRGICAGVAGGQILNLTERRVTDFLGEKGAALFRQVNGQNHFLIVLQY